MTERAPAATTHGIPLPDTITDFVIEQLRDRIVLGALKPGQKLPVYELAKELGVSRVPLREAVRQLEAEFLVENVPRRGTVVRRFHEQDLRDAFEILHTVESIAARRAAQTAASDTIATMQYWLEEMQRLARRKVSQTSEETLHAHRAFHFALFQASGEGVLCQHLCMLWNTCERYVINGRDLERQAEAAREHAALVERIAAHDPAGTESALQTHLQASLAAALRYLDSMGLSTNS